MRLRRATGIGVLFLCCIAGKLAADEEEGYVDFSSQITPVCEVDYLKVAPPEGWINVPIDTGSDYLSGCQMMLIVNEELQGVLRVLSCRAPGRLQLLAPRLLPELWRAAHGRERGPAGG